MSTTIRHVILRKDVVKRDWKNGRKVLVNEIYPKTEKPIENAEWEFGPQGGHTPVLETGYGGVEVGTFTEKTSQDRHRHLACTEIYTVIEGTMTITIGDEDIVLQSGDEIIVLPGVIHKVLDNKKSFLTRVHAINCHGTRDKYIEKNGVWCQELTLQNQQKATKPVDLNS